MLSQNDFKSLFFQLFKIFKANAPYLNDLDSAVGDGDHGDTIRRGFKAAARAAEPTHTNIGKLFDAVSDALAEETGGAIGPLLAAFFAEGGMVFSGLQNVGYDQLRKFFIRGYEAIVDVGGAQPGDKTLIDALFPAIHLMEANDQIPLSNALKLAADAAEKGAEATRDLTPSKGRARFVGERARGHTDPGAVSFAMIIREFQHISEGVSVDEPDFEEKFDIQHPQTSGMFLNNPAEMVFEDNRGLAFAYPNLVRMTPSSVLVRAKLKEEGKVGLAIGHGGGHTPSMGGFIGHGLLDADVYGPLFTCASGLKIAKAIELADQGAGVVLLVSNHAGDVLNARLAQRRAEQMGFAVDSVLLSDDVATAPRERFEERRGLGGLLFPLKIGGGAAESGLGLSEVASLMRITNERTATLSVAARSPRHPVTGKFLFDLPDGQIEVGTGVHGEVGVYRGDLLPADDLVKLMLDELINDLDVFLNDEVLVFINGSGGTSKMELHILYQSVVNQLNRKGLKLTAGVTGSYFTTLNMGGFSISLCAMDDDAKPWWDAPASSANFRWPIN